MAQADQRLSGICYSVDHGEMRCHKLAPGCMAVLLASCEKQQAVRLGQEMLAGWQRIADSASSSVGAASGLSIGLAAVASLPANFPAQELVSGAARCLSGAQSSGGNCLKSIEL